ncbi:imidazolonepropionase [Chitinimonas koreensis]|uniref:imidazolonepropionase n=1 Tax=Chitinimonas koreensis TaxID=356302 RepID=UPI0003FFB8DA|nr:imidazolonepropionase [Chitinimonas koreensis]QNM96050.1 imidazolonepropionase [Chitinimonas koreensis]
MSATLIRNVHLATMADSAATANGAGYGELRDAALLVRDGRIAWLGRADALTGEIAAGVAEEIDGEGGWLTPGLIDCHTHLVFGGDRSHEFELRLEGASYEEIARAGGGIRSTVAATRAAGEDALFAAARGRLARLEAEGVTRVEIKSGYGLDFDSERRMLRVARRLGAAGGAAVHTTYLAAHALPPEYQGRQDDYVAACIAWLGILHGEGLIDAVDAFCENIAFSPAQVERLFDAAGALGLPVKLHAEQLSDQGGAGLVARRRGLSADHLEWLDADGIAAMAAAGTVAVMLPVAFYYLRETRLPPIDALRAAGVAMAVATDCNPGTAPCTSALLALNMACTLFRLTPAEALAGMTCHAARALGVQDQAGTLEVGKRADLALWRIGRPAELCYWLGAAPLAGRWVGGVKMA